MERKSLLTKYVNAALARLRFEKAVYTLQMGLFGAVLFAVLILVASRLFVLPYYGRIAWLAATVVLVATMILMIYKRLRQEEAIRRLDQYMPDNLLITAMGVQASETHLALPLIESAELQVATAFEQFKKRQKHYVNPKMLGGFLVLAACLALLIAFPSEAQMEAEAVKKEQEIIEEVKKEVQDLVKKEQLPEVKKELQELVEKLKEAELSEEALKELVKKQKELRLKEQRLAEKKEAADKSGNPADALTESEEQQLNELRKLSDQLAKNAGKAQTALNKIGKAPALPALANANDPSSSSENGGKPGTAGGEGTGEGEGNDDDQANEDENEDENEDQEEKAEGQGTATGQGQNQGSGSGAGQGQGQGQGSGSGTGQGSGQGQGSGSGAGGQGQGSGSGGSGAGKGSGGRNLLSVPFDRVGEKGETSVDGGKLGQGDFIEEHETQGPVEKGTIRPYQEVIGDYKDSYLQSTDKMQLPTDLQHILSDYFSSIE